MKQLIDGAVPAVYLRPVAGPMLILRNRRSSRSEQSVASVTCAKHTRSSDFGH